MISYISLNSFRLNSVSESVDATRESGSASCFPVTSRTGFLVTSRTGMSSEKSSFFFQKPYLRISDGVIKDNFS